MSQVEFHPKIIVTANPAKIQQGQMINISSFIFDSFSGQPMPFDKIYMQIIDEAGIETWPLSTIEENNDKINKLISTSEMKPGKYTVRITPSRKLHPLGATQFEIEKKGISIIIPLIPLALIAVPSSISREKIQSEFIEPGAVPVDKIAWLVYRTERDSRVCPICLPDEGKLFRPDDTDLPKIPRHINCRCNFDVITERMVQERFRDEMNAMILEENAMRAYEITQIVEVSQKGLKQMEMI